MFTTVNWSTPQTVTVTGVNDFLPDLNIAYTIVTGNTVSGDAGYNGLVVDDVAVINGMFINYIKASNTETNDEFGSSVAMSADGNTLAVSATGERSNATGIDGNQADNSVVTAGAVYVYTRTGSVWMQQAYLKASNTGSGDSFGYSLALSSDGSTLAVSALGEASNATGIGGNQADNSAGLAGAVYVFTRASSVWSQQAYVKASNSAAGDGFGWSVSLSSDGNTLAVGAVGEDSNATVINGVQADNSALGAGAVYAFTRAGSVWTQQAYVKASNTEATDRFGWSVSLSSDGNTLAVGAYGESSSATGIGGDQANNSVADSGAVYVFTRAGVIWTQQAYVKASNTNASDTFGFSVAVSSDSNTLAVGARDEDSNAGGINGDQTNNSAANAGAVYVFTRAGSVWTQEAYVKASNSGGGDLFGSSVALSSNGNTLVVGALGEASNATDVNLSQTDNSASGSGAAYIFVRALSVWSQAGYVKASNTDAGDHFGTSLALSSDGNTLAVGAPNESSNATGIGGNQANNSATSAGAVYVYP
ncbi:MAG: integrin [Sandaracinaceae bacterium]|nr:integrin [Sandaracinaceae bacterium]